MSNPASTLPILLKELYNGLTQNGLRYRAKVTSINPPILNKS